MRTSEIKGAINRIQELKNLVVSIDDCDRDKRLKVTELFKDLTGNFRKASLDTSDLKIIKNQVSGVFDGYNSTEPDKKYLRKVTKGIVKTLGLFVEQWEDFSTSKSVVVLTEAEDTLFSQSIDKLLGRFGSTNNVTDLSTYTPPDERMWANDSDILSNASVFKPLKGKFGTRTAPVILTCYLHKALKKDLSEAGFDCHNLFDEYTFIDNAVVYGMRKDYVLTRFSSGDFDSLNETQLLAHIQSKITHRNLYLCSDYVVIKDHLYFLVLPELKNKPRFDEWQIHNK